jgi:hypothetical protein
VAWIEEPDTFGIRLAGPISGPDLRGILDWQGAWSKGRTEHYVICDLSGAGAASPEARQVMSGHERDTRIRVCSVCFGASFTIRVIVNMIVRAMKFLRPAALETAEIVFVATEGDARAEIERRRSAGESIGHASVRRESTA